MRRSGAAGCHSVVCTAGTARAEAMARSNSVSVTGFTRCTSKLASAVRCRSCSWPQPVSATMMARYAADGRPQFIAFIV